MNKTQFYKILFLVSFWTIAVTYLIFYEGVALSFKPPADLINTGMAYNFRASLLTSVMFTLFVGSIMAGFEVLYLNNLLRKKPLGMTLFIKTVYYLLNIFFWSSLATLIIYSFYLDKSLFNDQVLDLFFKYLSGTRIYMTMSFWCITIFISLFILQVSDKFGQGVLINFLLGKYHQPKEEARIFMFMDLKSSTTYAEKLGHIKYSQLIQDCFYDVTEVIMKYHAQIYQYVGDEVVLSWETDKGIKDTNCIKTFFGYEKLLNSKREYYKNKYGMVPEFKAGVNSGYVTVAEVGELKKELAYHGDVLNTAARIQGKCNEFQKRILISESLKILLEKQPKFKFELIDNVRLKGKTQSINIYDVKPL
jgi:adenylate cyclase